MAWNSLSVHISDSCRSQYRRAQTDNGRRGALHCSACKWCLWPAHAARLPAAEAASEWHRRRPGSIPHTQRPTDSRTESRPRGLMDSRTDGRKSMTRRAFCAPAKRGISGRRLVRNHRTLCSRTRVVAYEERKCADTIGTVPVPWAGHFQC